jgi:hypothetical protein
MARLKRTSAVIETARHRFAGLKSIDENFDFGPGFKRKDVEDEIKDAQDTLDEYNGILSTADEVKNRYDSKERELQTKNARILSMVAARFGTDSSEYEQCGGTRTSERKKPTRKGKGSRGTSGAPGTGGNNPPQP